MTKYYLSHPYTGNEAYNVKESEVFATLLAKEYPNSLIINPLTAMVHTGYANLPYDSILKQCLELLSFCDSIIMSGDWKNSKGCMAEYNYAKENGMDILYIETLGGALI